MTIDMDWSPSFCLACDRQTDGNVYCSEACRLAEYDAGSNAGSAASSPTSSRGPISWPATRKSTNGFFMEPAYNFSNAQPYGSTPSPRAAHFYQPSRPRSSPIAYSTKPVLPLRVPNRVSSPCRAHNRHHPQNQFSCPTSRGELSGPMLVHLTNLDTRGGNPHIRNLPPRF